MVIVVSFVVYFLEVVLRMQVSKKKSNVVASTPSVAVAIALEVTNAAVKPAFHAKLLGSDLAGGAKRSTQQHHTRLGAFRCMRPQFLALRNAGADVKWPALLVRRCSCIPTKTTDSVVQPFIRPEPL